MNQAALVARSAGFAVAHLEIPVSGQGRTCLATTSSGDEIVLKWSDEQDWVDSLPRAVEYADVLRSRGYPAPETLFSGAVEGVGHGWVQRRLPGVPSIDGLGPRLLDDVMQAIEHQADAAHSVDVPDHGDWSWVPAVVHDDEAGWWRSARALSPEVAYLCDRLAAWVAEVGRPAVRNDFVHLDLNFSNILNVDGRLSGIVDLDHVSIGDRSVDITSLIFGFSRVAFHAGRPYPTAEAAQLRESIRSISGEEGWRQALVYRSIAALGWSNADGMRVAVDEAVFNVEGALSLDD